MPCWRFLIEQPAESLQRLVMMTRGLADPLASAYCRLYIAYRALKFPMYDTGRFVFLFTHRHLLMLINGSFMHAYLAY